MKMNKKPILAIIVPCYCEEKVLPETIIRLSSLRHKLISAGKISENSYILFVDDGSSDRTWEIIFKANQEKPLIKGLKLSRNFGHQNALISGMEHVCDRCDCLVTIDADLQDDVDAIEKGVDEYILGANIVYFIRKERQADSFFKKNTAQFFYKLALAMGVDLVYNHADYRLLDQKVLKTFLRFNETNLFLRGVFPLIGFKASLVYYDRQKRFAGESKYPLMKMVAFAIDGITSFSVVPLRLVSIAGLVVFLISAIMASYAFILGFRPGSTVPGWASTVLPIYFIGGVQLLSLGIIGEYIGKIYKETKARPLYVVDEILG